MRNGNTEVSAVHSYTIAPGVVVQIQNVPDAVDFVDSVLDELAAMVRVGATREVASGEIGQSTVVALAAAEMAAVRHLKGLLPYLSKAAWGQQRNASEPANA